MTKFIYSIYKSVFYFLCLLIICLHPSVGQAIKIQHTKNLSAKKLAVDNTLLDVMSDTAIAVKNIFWASEPVLPNETVMIAGNDLLNVQRIEIRAVNTETKSNNKVNFQTAKPLQATNESLKFILPANLKKGSFECRFIGNGWQQTIFLNKPSIWWWQGDGGTFATIGGWLRAFGKSLQLDNASKILLTDKNGKIFPLQSTSVDEFSLSIQLPAYLVPGKYKLIIKNSIPQLSSNVSEIEIKKTNLYPNNVFNVMDYYGADSTKEIKKTVTGYDKPINRNRAIDAALKMAADNGGGVVYFPEGKYAYDGQMIVPPHTTIKGAAMGVTILTFGKGGFSLDGGSDERRMDDSDDKNLPPVLITGDDYHIEDMSIYLPRHFTQGIQSGDGFKMERVRVRIDRYWIRSGKREREVLMRIGNNCTIKDCDLLAQGTTVFFKGKGEYIANNTIMAGDLLLSMKNGDGAIIEDNKFVSIDPQAYINLDGNGRNIYYARNSHTSQFVHESDFSFTFDGHGTAYFGKVLATEGLSVTLAADPKFTTWADANNDLWNHTAIAIIDGKGAGQYRFITSFKGRQWKMDTPFDVVPDSSSIVSIVPFRGRLLVVNNIFEDAHWVNMGYGTSLDVICANNKLKRCAMLLNYGRKESDGVQPSWYIQYLNNDISEGYTYVQNNGDMRNPTVFGGTATKFCVHRGTHLYSDNSGQIEVGGNSADVLIEHCILDNPKNRILIHEKATGVLLRENQFLYPKNSNYTDNCLEKALLIPAIK